HSSPTCRGEAALSYISRWITQLQLCHRRHDCKTDDCTVVRRTGPGRGPDGRPGRGPDRGVAENTLAPGSATLRLTRCRDGTSPHGHHRPGAAGEDDGPGAAGG